MIGLLVLAAVGLQDPPPQPVAIGDIAGRVVDRATGQPLAGVALEVVGHPIAARTDREGRFALTNVPAGRQAVAVSLVGYVFVRREVNVPAADTVSLTIPLTEGTGAYAEDVQVTAVFPEREAGAPSQQTLGSADLQNLRGLLLDDPVRAVGVLPGVGSSDDLYAEFSVRGSPFAKVGVAVDGVPTQLLTHTVQGIEDGGSLSMVNSDILDSLSLLSGGYSQRYGSRTGAQMEMTLREGSRRRTGARLALSGTNSSVVAEGPIGRSQRGAWLFSARKSYLDYIIDRLSDENAFVFGFADLAGKVAFDVTPRHTIQLTMLAGRSTYHADLEETGVNSPHIARNTGALGVVTWRYARSAALLVTQRVSVGAVEFWDRGPTLVWLDEGEAVNVGYRADASLALAPTWSLEGGASIERVREGLVQRRVVVPPTTSVTEEDVHATSTLGGGWAQVRWGRPDGLGAAAGLRVDHWSHAEATRVSPWAQGQVPLPWQMTARAGTGIYRQPPSPASVAGLRGTPGLDPERAVHLDVGLERRFGGTSRALVTWYLRDEQDGIDLPDDEFRMVGGRVRPPSVTMRYENRLSGTSRGVEVMVQRRAASGLSGWAAYSLGRTRERDVVTGESWYADYDQRHAVSLYGSYRLNDRTSVSGRFRWSSNYPVRGYIREWTDAPAPPPSSQPARYILTDVRNGDRVMDYARLDLRANRTFVWTRARMTLFAEVGNTWDRTNWRVGEGSVRLTTGEVRSLMTSLIPFVPSLGCLVEF